MDYVRFLEGIEIKKKAKINYLLEEGKKKKFQSWTGSLFPGLYDFFMEKSVFSGLFESDYTRHYEILKENLSGIKQSYLLELATGSGLLAYFLNNTNHYFGVDTSKGLLKKSYKRFKKAGFKDYELFLASADSLPFADSNFDFEVCNLSLNFFDDLGKVIHEIKRTLKVGGQFFCSIPVPERRSTDNSSRKRIRGKLYSEKQLQELFSRENFEFHHLPYKNGSLLYFIARSF
ncbi:MAG: class I SAM-dependent methyltransferase [Kosmotogaceae bacterium]